MASYNLPSSFEEQSNDFSDLYHLGFNPEVNSLSLSLSLSTGIPNHGDLITPCLELEKKRKEVKVIQKKISGKNNLFLFV